MKHKNIDEIKKFESLPKIIKLFSDQEIKNISELYNSLPVTKHNKKQNVIKKRWLQNYNKSFPDNLIITAKGVINTKYTRNITIGETILPNNVPNFSQRL